MKRFLLYMALPFAAMLSALPIAADEKREAVVIQKADNTDLTVEFSASPVLSFRNDSLVITAGDVSIFALSDVRKVYFGAAVPTSVSNVSAGQRLYFADSQTIIATGISQEDVAVYNINGMKMPAEISRTADGFTISLSALPRGIYIIKTKVQTFKINKR